jgi:hypothetical protein
MNSSESVDRILFHWQGLNFLMKKGGIHYLNYLLAKADTPNSELPDISKVREWSYKDLLRLPTSQQKEWMDACYQELDSLCKCDVYVLPTCTIMDCVRKRLRTNLGTPYVYFSLLTRFPSRLRSLHFSCMAQGMRRTEVALL